MGFAGAADGDDLSAAVLLRGDPAVSVLLDGGHVIQAECRTAQLQGPQSVLDLVADARAHQASLVRNRLSALADDDDVCRDRRHLPVAVLQHAGGLRDRTLAFSRQPLCRAWNLSRLSGAAVDP